MPTPKRKRAEGVPPTTRKRRAPKLAKDEKAAITKAARDLAAEVSEQIEEAKASTRRVSPEERKVRNERARRRRLAARRNGRTEKVYCAGRNMMGKPCMQPPLLPENWDGDEEVTGLYCLWHEPNVTRDQRESFDTFGTSKRPVYRRVTPSEMAHELIQRSPHYFLRPHLKALGLRMDDDGTLEQVGSGLKIHGFSRGGQVIRSPYPDLVGQVNIAEKLLDRIYGKARQSVDLASSTTTVAVHVVMDVDRVTKVSDVLAQAGALTNGNGHVIEGTAEEIVDEEGDLV